MRPGYPSPLGARVGFPDSFRGRTGAATRDQLTLFDLRPSRVLESLEALDPDRMTPIEALTALAELRRLAREEET